MHVIHMLSRQCIDYKVIINKGRKCFDVGMKTDENGICMAVLWSQAHLIPVSVVCPCE
jgi:hypothetical protein